MALDVLPPTRVDLKRTWDFSSGILRCTDPVNNTDVVNKQFLSSYSPSISTTDDVPEGSTNLYYTDLRAVNAIKSDTDWNATDWDTAYGWGDHASAGYLTTETDPVVGAINGIVKADGAGNISQAIAGTDYLATGGWYDTTQNTINLSDFNDDLSYEAPLTFGTGLTRTGDTVNCDITQYTDSDAVSAIKADIDWNATDWDLAYGWGNHADEGYLTDAPIDTKYYARKDGAWEEIVGGTTTWGAITGTQSDVNVSGFTNDAGYITDLTSFTTDNLVEGLTNKYFPGFSDLLTDYAFTDNSSDWDTAYGWGDHSLAGYLTTETDPVFTAWLATVNPTNWDTAYGWGDHSTEGYLVASADELIFKTTATLNLYVDETGNDTTGDGSVGNPYRQITRALEDVKEQMVHTVNIFVNGTTFNATTITKQGFPNSTIKLNIKGSVNELTAELSNTGTDS